MCMLREVRYRSRRPTPRDRFDAGHAVFVPEVIMVLTKEEYHE